MPLAFTVPKSFVALLSVILPTATKFAVPLTVRLPVDVVMLLLPTEAAEKVKAPLFSTLTAAAFVPVSVLTTVFSGEVELPIVTPPVSCSVVAVMSAVPPPVVKVPFELITIAPLVPLLLKPAEPSVMSLPLIVKVSVPVRVNVSIVNTSSRNTFWTIYVRTTSL